jgi:UDP-2,3-diacylglucosamine pyrophosphatase LpxH
MLAQQILNNINIKLKKEVIKLPGFYGQSNKDTIFAMDFISRIDKCQISNDWNDIATYSNFWLCLHGEAKEWLASKARHLHLTLEQKTWTWIWPIFKCELATVLDDKLINVLAKMAHRPNEDPRAFFSRSEKMFHVLNKNYTSDCIKLERPAQQSQGGF